MLAKNEKLISYISTLPFGVVRAAWIARATMERGREKRLQSLLAESGMEAVDCKGLITEDGRSVVKIRGASYALRKDVHDDRLQKEIEFAKKRQSAQRASEMATPTTEPSESMADSACPQIINKKPCGGALNRNRICPSCELGQQGYRFRYSCEACGFDIVSRKELFA